MRIKPNLRVVWGLVSLESSHPSPQSSWRADRLGPRMGVRSQNFPGDIPHTHTLCCSLLSAAWTPHIIPLSRPPSSKASCFPDPPEAESPQRLSAPWGSLQSRPRPQQLWAQQPGLVLS